MSHPMQLTAIERADLWTLASNLQTAAFDRETIAVRGGTFRHNEYAAAPRILAAACIAQLPGAPFGNLWPVTDVTERDRLARALVDVTCADSPAEVPAPWVGIAPDYITDGPGYAGPVTVCLWPSEPGAVTVLTQDAAGRPVVAHDSTATRAALAASEDRANRLAAALATMLGAAMGEGLDNKSNVWRSAMMDADAALALHDGAQPAAAPLHPGASDEAYAARVAYLESEGATTSDAQAVADAECRP